MEKQKRIDILQFCAAQCIHCYDGCYLEKHMDMFRCMMNDQDCANICSLTAKLLERNSENIDIFLNLCSEMCERCATECDKYPGMEHCKKCAEACRKCIAMCNEQELIH